MSNTRRKQNSTAPLVNAFICKAQLSVMIVNCRGEEGAWFKDKIAEITKTCEMMHRVYGQDGLGKEAIVHLHYFKGDADWYITERDMSAVQHQAFGAADLGLGAELGYISIAELIANGVELDLHWEPKTLRMALATTT